MISGQAFDDLCEAFPRWIQPEAVRKQVVREASKLRDNKATSETKAAAVLKNQPNSSEGHETDSVHASTKPRNDLKALPMISFSPPSPEVPDMVGYSPSTSNTGSVESQVRRSITPEGHAANEMEQDSPSPDNHSLPLTDTVFRFTGALIQSLKYPVEMLESLWQSHIPPGYIRVSWTCVSDLI